jgi:hypothetical protein
LAEQEYTHLTGDVVVLCTAQGTKYNEMGCQPCFPLGAADIGLQLSVRERLPLWLLALTYVFGLSVETLISLRVW